VNAASQSARERLRDWQLTRQRFDLLLTHLSADASERGARYEMLRGRLVVFFARRMFALPEDLADEVLNRLARRLEEGEAIGRIEGYALGIARHVAQEQYARSNRESAAAEEFYWNVSRQTHTTDEEQELRLERMKRCLERLPRPDGVLLSEYCLAEGGGKIAARKRLADAQGMTQAALRKRIFVLRGMIQRCMKRQSGSRAVQ
jgi:DNA-directed RNA polymerase specialized sigma24 family protein